MFVNHLNLKCPYAPAISQEEYERLIEKHINDEKKCIDIYKKQIEDFTIFLPCIDGDTWLVKQESMWNKATEIKGKLIKFDNLKKIRYWVSRNENTDVYLSHDATHFAPRVQTGLIEHCDFCRLWSNVCEECPHVHFFEYNRYLDVQSIADFILPF